MKNRLDENREKSQQNRFKIVNYTRALSETPEQSSPSSKNLTIVDVEKDRNLASEAATTSGQSNSYSDISDEPFVYDIYIADVESSEQLYPDSLDLNDLRLVLMDEVFCSYYAYM